MSKSTLTVAAIIVLLVAVAVGLWSYRAGQQAVPTGSAPEQVGQSSGTPQADLSTPTPATSSPGKLAWSFTEIAAEDPMSGPKTAVTLTAEGIGKKYDLGTHTGSCAVIETSQWQLLPNEKTGVICWWAGGGTEIGVFEEGGKLIVKTGDIEESTAESDGFRGNFKAVAEVQ